MLHPLAQGPQLPAPCPHILHSCFSGGCALLGPIPTRALPLPTLTVHAPKAFPAFWSSPPGAPQAPTCSSSPTRPPDPAPNGLTPSLRAQHRVLQTYPLSLHILVRHFIAGKCVCPAQPITEPLQQPGS